jgi:hypothetical protein
LQASQVVSVLDPTACPLVRTKLVEAASVDQMLRRPELLQ